MWRSKHMSQISTWFRAPNAARRPSAEHDITGRSRQFEGAIICASFDPGFQMYMHRSVLTKTLLSEIEKSMERISSLGAPLRFGLGVCQVAIDSSLSMLQMVKCLLPAEAKYFES